MRKKSQNNHAYQKNELDYFLMQNCHKYDINCDISSVFCKFIYAVMLLIKFCKQMWPNDA